ncbi:MAG: glycoside hydrolase family 9 protein [Defluviitaleaceae bacterium]|nr:glycoside hydrolase family 9 protein [Defluviitaleaceae bacterium]MCL2273505.1 glycoside hydrolase family 9 protein [Defluviitaleaceae bacterium]
MKSVHINQMGYRPHDIKKAVIPEKSASFCVLRVCDEESVYEGTAGEGVEYAVGGESVRVADFSGITDVGEYMICAGGKRSHAFKIGDDPYAGLRTALLDFFNFQKCGVDVECGTWSHPACHAEPATVYGLPIKKDVSGGWHDAGDYGRYIVVAAKAVADLLFANELAQKRDDNLLDTVWFELEWMLKMQDEKSGGVYHKVSCHNFNALNEMPHHEKNELVLSPISATATATFAATMALASRSFPQKRDELLNVARRAWAWCIANPDAPNFANPEGITTGGYGDRDDKDERFWAACALFAATGESAFHEFIKASEIYTGLGWANVGTYGIVSYLYHARQFSDVQLAARMKDALHTLCKKIMHEYRIDPYGISLGDDYKWGSNMTVANNAMTLLLARPFAQLSEEYTQAAWEHLHYLLGRNPLSQSYITGFGANPPKYPHHRPSEAVGAPMPGMVVGGPNKFITQDPALKEYCEGNPPAKCYIDHAHSFAGNEVTIYWNSPVYFMAAVLGV